jgi:AcrR family transcriptional regulator
MRQSARATADGRTDGILNSVRGPFARKGFDGTSMQDLAAAAGMSVGNFYRYYPSKFALIGALVDRSAKELTAGLAPLRNAPDPLEALRGFLHQCLIETDDEEAALWVQISAAALIYPEIAAIKRGTDEALRAEVVATLRTTLGMRGADEERRLQDVVDFLVYCTAGLFQHRAYEGRDAFAGKVEGLTERLFAAVKSDLAAPNGGLPAQRDALVDA